MKLLAYAPLGPFDKIDHPIILIVQTVIAFYCFRLFFALRRTAQPLPQIVGVMAFAVLANLLARATHREWFWISDITQFVALGAMVLASFYVVQHQTVQATKQPNAPVVVADFFDRIETKATWAFGLLLAAIVTYAYIDTYTQRQKDNLQALAAAEKAKAQATAENSQQLCEVKVQQQTVIAAVTSISAATGTIIANQTKNMAILTNGQQDVKKEFKKQSKRVEKTIQATVIDARPLEPKQAKPIEKTDEEKEKEKQNLWNKAKRFFHLSAKLDTLGVTDSDTLVFQ
ncbi:hypothetical protein [Spirosoma litoris]